MLILEENKTNADISQIERVYRENFSSNERIPTWFFKSRAKKNFVRLFSIYNESQWVGFTYVVRNKDTALVLYLAIDKKFQNQGLGGKALEQLTRTFHKKHICLLTPSSNDSNRQFYLDHKFKKADFMLKKSNTLYEVIQFGDKLSGMELTETIDKFYGPILKLRSRTQIIKV
ncbi:GNAT family N-acetyltransferase [Companilactobacillus baiquanensis]|uniref:GNAT family N-acetyltransferase n=1 Tax=Companilactobacillus baiquanensis TaxID=2486005 RepID=A0ABW1UVJ4_9LACO|nr:GNAT family N-acetyltransferase [Companilactobacillus baiquanensis]